MSEQKSPLALRVMSYNIKGSAASKRTKHVEAVARVICDVAPDLAGLQEVHRRTHFSREEDQVAQLEELTGMTATFGPSFERGKGDYGNLILSRTSVTSRLHMLPGRGEPRSLLEGILEVRDCPISFFVTHLSAWGWMERKTRRLQAEAVARLVFESGNPFVLTGDFNTTPSSDELRVFRAGELVTSCFPGANASHRYTRQCLDYIFVHPSWEIRDARVLRAGPSDHWPLIAELAR